MNNISIFPIRREENFCLFHNKTHICLYSNLSLMALLEDCGFNVDHIDNFFLILNTLPKKT